MSKHPFDFTAIRADIQDALRKVGEKHGLAVGIGNIRYTHDSFRCKLEAFKAGEQEAGRPASEIKWAKDFEKHASSFGIRSKVGDTVMNKYTILGMKGERIVASCEPIGKGKRVLIAVSAVRAYETNNNR